MKKFREQESEKITLVVAEPARRLLSLTLYSSTVYYKQLDKGLFITGITEADTVYTEVYSIGAVVAGTYFVDENNIVYLNTLDGSHPKDHFMFYTFKVFFSDKPLNYSSTLSNGIEVFYNPIFKNTGFFGQEIDFINQKNETIDSQGQVSFYNDFEFWKKNFNKYYWENRVIKIYSLRLGQEESLSLIFSGKITDKSYSDTVISLKIKNVVQFLKNKLPYNTFESLSNVYLKDEEKKRVIRTVYGKVSGFLPQNISQKLPSGFKLTGTIDFNTITNFIDGVGTLFLSEVKQGDTIQIQGSFELYTVDWVLSNTSILINQKPTVAYTGTICNVLPTSIDGTFSNRKWKIANHPIFQKQNTITAMSAQNKLKIDGTVEFYEVGERIWVGASDFSSGSFVDIVSINEFTNVITISTNVSYANIGLKTILPSVKNVSVDGISLMPNRDYTVDNTNAVITILPSAETNISQYTVLDNYEVQAGNPWVNTNTSFTVYPVSGNSGNMADFKDKVKAGMYIQVSTTNPTFYKIKRVLAFSSNATVELYTPTTGQTVTSGTIKIKSFVFDTDAKLSCDVMGKTDDGTSNGNLLENPSDVLKDILLSSGTLISEIDEDSFDRVKNLETSKICLAIPQKQGSGINDNRSYVNIINNSYLGILSVDENFKIFIDSIKPNFFKTKTKITNLDIVKYQLDTFSILQSESVQVEYNYNEYNQLTQNELLSYSTVSTENAKYISKLVNSLSLKTALRTQEDADRLARRWKLIGDFSSNKVKISGFSDISSLKINDAVVFSSPSLNEGYGKSKNILGFVSSVKTNGQTTEIDILDLGNFNYRCAKIVDDSYTSLTLEDVDNINQSGYYTDDDGSIDGDEETLDTNLIW